MTKKHIIELSDKEIYQVWAILAWFPGKPVSGTLVKKFSGVARNYEFRKKMEAKYESVIEDRIIDLGAWLKDDRAKREGTNG